jgi:ubiquinone/menaquinone biosynthesis C-methylase UbiE
MAQEYLKKWGSQDQCHRHLSVYAAHAEQQVRETGLSPERFDFLVMAAHKLSFPDNSFDIVAGWSILHHLNAETAMNEIYCVLLW